MSAQFKVSVSTTELKVVVKSVGISNGGNGGSGDVSGPGSSSSGNIATFSSNTGKVIQDSGQSLSALVASVAGKETAGAADDAIAAHVGASDPHPQYTTSAELSASVAAGLAKVAPRVGFYIGPASDANSATYDYTTDGTADEVQINAALSAIGGNYGVVFLMPGTYTLSNFVSMPSKARIVTYAGVVIQPATSYSPTIKTIDGYSFRCLITNSDHSSGNSEIAIIGPGTITAPAASVLTPNSVAGPSFAAILFNKVTDSLIEGINSNDVLWSITGGELAGVRQYTIGLYESHRNIIRACRLNKCGNDNISIRRDSSNNIVEGVIGQDSLYGHAVGQVSSGSGIFGGTAGGNASGNRWINCTGIGDLATATIATAAIVNHGGFDNSIESCLSVNCGVGFVQTGNSQNSGIKNCQVVHPKYYGIWMRTDSSGTNLNNKTSDCIVTMSSDTIYGALFEATGSGFDCKKCSIDNFKAIGADGASQVGIGIITNTVAPGTNGGEVSDLVITNPQITNCGASGIYIDTKNSSGVIGRVFIQGGEIKDCLNGIRAGAITTPGLVTNFTVNGTVINSSVASSNGIELVATSGWSCDGVRIRVSGVAISDDASSSENRFTFCDTSSSGTPTPSLSGLGSAAIDLAYGKTGTGALALQNGPTFIGPVLIPSASEAISAGSDVGATTITNATNKASIIAMPHYSSGSASKVSTLVASSASGVNLVAIGGGSASHNAATDVQIRTGATATTTSGAVALSADSGQNISVPVGLVAGYLRVGEVTASPASRQDNFTTTGLSTCAHLILTPTASCVFAGMAGGVAGRIITVSNESTDYMVLIPHEDTGSTAANRFTVPDKRPLLLMPGDSYDFVYSGSTNRWKLRNPKSFTSQLNEFNDYISGSGPLASSVNNAGTGASAQAGTYGGNSTERATGELQIDTGTTSTGSQWLGGHSVNQFAPAQGAALYVCRIALEQLDDNSGAQTFMVAAGFHDGGGTADVTDGVYWKYKRATSANWLRSVAAAAARTETAGSTAAATTYVWLGIFINPGWTRADYFLSNDSVTWTIEGSISSGLPSASQLVGVGVNIAKSTGTTQQNVSIDFQGYRYDVAR